MTRTIGKIFAVIAGVLLLLYALGVAAFSQVYMPNTFINGADISMRSKNKLPQEFASSWSDYALQIRGKDGKKDEISAKDFGYKETLENVSNIDANPWAWPVLSFVKKDHAIETKVEYDDSKLESILAALHVIADSDITDPEPEKIAYKAGTGYVIADAVEGTRVDGPKLKQSVLAAFHSQEEDLDLDEKKLYVQAKPAENRSAMENHVKSLNEIEGFTLSYNFSDRTEELAGEPLIALYGSNPDGSLSPSEEKVKAYVDMLADKYDTFRSTRDFTATGGATMRIKGGIYGWQTDREKTREELLAALKEKTTKELTPVYKRKALHRNVDDVGNSYIEIDIARQHMWLYNNGELVVDTPVVTGDPLDGNSTPTGVQEVWMKETGRYLTGDTWKSWVNYWMPFDWTGCGIHDSSWRGSYGGNIYRGGGSHGCVNTPPKIAGTFYKNAFKGMPVIVYNSAKHAI